jgi:hypothetical protein
MRKLLIICSIAAPWAAFAACSDDDGSDVLPNGPPGSGGSAGTSAVSDAGPGGSGAGTGGSSGTRGGSSGAGGSAGCTVVPAPDAGLDAGAADAGELDAGAADASTDASTAGLGPVSFAADVHPIFEASCGPCHVTLGTAGHNVGGEIEQAYLDAVRLGQTLVQRIDGGGMPPPDAPAPNACGSNGGGFQPGDPGCLTVDEVALVQAWINQCFPP